MMPSNFRSLFRYFLGRRSPVIKRHCFDEQHGVETSGLIDGKHLPTGHAHDAFSTAYFGVPPSRFSNMIREWQATPQTQSIEKCTFIDIGCGKGRALLLASEMGFRKVVGLELNATLAEIATRNIEQWRSAGRDRSQAQVLRGDATTLAPDLISGPTLLYLYNPFRGPALHSLLTALRRQREMQNAPLDLLYLYPEFESEFAEFPVFQLLWHKPIPLAPDEFADGLSSPTDPCSLYRRKRES